MRELPVNAASADADAQSDRWDFGPEGVLPDGLSPEAVRRVRGRPEEGVPAEGEWELQEVSLLPMLQSHDPSALLGHVLFKGDVRVV